MTNEGSTHVLHAVVVRSLATRPREDESLFLSERYPMVNRPFSYVANKCGSKLFHLFRWWRRGEEGKWSAMPLLYPCWGYITHRKF